MATISQKEYLKKYLSSNKKEKVKKKKKPKVVGQGIKIIDEDFDLARMSALDDIQMDIYGNPEDAPVIAGIIDDRPDDVKFTTKKWKVVNQDDGFNSSITVEQVGNKSNLPDGMYRSNSDSDLSPQRNDNGKSNQESKSHKPRKTTKQNASDSDLSPPRKMKQESDSDLSPPRKKKNNDSDLSPPRHKNNSKRKESDSDLSPPRYNNKSNKNGSDSDLSPQRESNSIRNSRQHTRDHVPSERRRTEHNDRPRNENRKRRSRWGTESDDKRSKSDRKPTSTLEGKRAGLQDAYQLKSENEDRRKKENELFGKLSEELTGRNAQAIKRNIRKGAIETEEDIAKKTELEAKQKVLEEKYSRWGKGLKQVQEHESKVQEYIHESSKPLARYKDDTDLEHVLKQKERIGDPMLEYMRKKDRERSNEVKFPLYQGPYATNRFNLRPGYRWDGVDRSNGYEKSYFESKSKRVAQEEEAYKWSTEDM